MFVYVTVWVDVGLDFPGMMTLVYLSLGAAKNQNNNPDTLAKRKSRRCYGFFLGPMVWKNKCRKMLLSIDLVVVVDLVFFCQIVMINFRWRSEKK
ncbi:hypothetical protein B0T20DRAFT_118052 [Sordaria brevicollis]|uniref:Transmembrane protein n=1 Tax=Sordaria brevicollis TaxID=83679 RepID=A0AAE0UEY2_SORBR|nr:hypothetical protein B0T20DRAFT_118052 [Sordaria brevicollis]